MTLAVTVELDRTSLARLEQKLTPELYREAIGRALVDVAHEAEGQVKDRTPVVTGTLQGSIRTDVRNATRFPDPEVRIGTETVYAWWIETGENRRGHKMRVKPGGYRMFDLGGKAAAEKSGEIVAAVAREIEQAWGKR